MMQGDACSLGLRICNNAGNPILPQDIRDLEITLGHLRKTYRAAQLNYENGLWFMPLSQQETFSLPAAPVCAQVRVHWANGVVEGRELRGLTVEQSLSREVI